MIWYQVSSELMAVSWPFSVCVCVPGFQSEDTLAFCASGRAVCYASLLNGKTFGATIEVSVAYGDKKLCIIH